MRLYVEEVKHSTPLVQTFTRLSTACIPLVRLHLCKYLSPSGTYALDLLTSDDVKLTGVSMTLAQMQALGSAALQGNYYHGFVSFTFPRPPTLKPGTYKLRLSVDNAYTYTPSEFIGWVKADTDRAIGITGNLTPLPLDAPYDLEIYALERP